MARKTVSTQAIIEVLDLILVLQPMLDYDVRVEHSCKKVEHEYVLHQLKKEWNGPIIICLDFTHLLSKWL